MNNIQLKLHKISTLLNLLSKVTLEEEVLIDTFSTSILFTIDEIDERAVRESFEQNGVEFSSRMERSGRWTFDIDLLGDE